MTLKVKMSMPDDSRHYPIKLCLIKYELEINVNNFKNRFFQLWVLFNNYLRVYSAGNLYIIVRNKHYIQALKKLQYFPHLIQDKGFKGTVVNGALPSFHEITLTVPLNYSSKLK